MKKFSKNYLFLFFVFIFSNHGNAELVGGHDRQRLQLIFHSALENYFASRPMLVQVDHLPLVLEDSEQNSAIINLYQVLAEEGYLVAEASVSQTDENGLKVTRSIRYLRSTDKPAQPIQVAQISSEKIIAVKQIQPPDLNRYQVRFSWRSAQLAPWVWANSLNANSLITMLKEANLQAKQGQAEFEWRDGAWQLLGRPQLF